MKKVIITLFLMVGFSCLSVNAQKTLKKPTKKTQTVTTPQRTAKPQKAHSQSRKPTKKPQKTQAVTIPNYSVRTQNERTQNDSVKPQPWITPNEPIRTQETNSQPSTSQPVLTGTINGHEYVDLGLSVKWATCNVGASSPSDYGDYFAWGEIWTKSKYKKANSVTYKKSMSDIAGDSRYDAARANWGSTWRLPTRAEINELIEKCKRKWTTLGGHNGYLITGPNGKSIFLPAAKFRIHGSSLLPKNKFGAYWSSTPYDSDTPKAYEIFLNSSGFGIGIGVRQAGLSVRPVSE